MTNRVILIDDHELLLRGLTLIFDTIDECEVVATTTNGKKVSSLIDAFAPDIVVTDAVMPDFDGLAVVRECATRACQVVCVWGGVYRYLSKRSG